MIARCRGFDEQKSQFFSDIYKNLPAQEVELFSGLVWGIRPA